MRRIRKRRVSSGAYRNTQPPRRARKRHTAASNSSGSTSSPRRVPPSVTRHGSKGDLLQLQPPCQCSHVNKLVPHQRANQIGRLNLKTTTFRRVVSPRPHSPRRTAHAFLAACPPPCRSAGAARTRRLTSRCVPFPARASALPIESSHEKVDRQRRVLLRSIYVTVTSTTRTSNSPHPVHSPYRLTPTPCVYLPKRPG